MEGKKIKQPSNWFCYVRAACAWGRFCLFSPFSQTGSCPELPYTMLSQLCSRKWGRYSIQLHQQFHQRDVEIACLLLKQGSTASSKLPPLLFQHRIALPFTSEIHAFIPTWFCCGLVLKHVFASGWHLEWVVAIHLKKNAFFWLEM